MAISLSALGARADPGRRHGAALAGVRAMLPVAAGLSPLAVLVGVSTAASGQSLLAGAVGSALIFSGGAQLAVAQLLAEGAGLAAVIVTGVVLNLRLVAYSAGISGHWTGASTRWRAAASLALVDPSYALAVDHAGRSADLADRLRYYAGAGATLWVGWQVLVAVGWLSGGRIPVAALADAGPLVLIAVLVPMIRGRQAWVAAIVAGAVAAAALLVPAGVGLLVAAPAGVAAALVSDRRPR